MTHTVEFSQAVVKAIFAPYIQYSTVVRPTACRVHDHG